VNSLLGGSHRSRTERVLPSLSSKQGKSEGQLGARAGAEGRGGEEGRATGAKTDGSLLWPHPSALRRVANGDEHGAKVISAKKHKLSKNKIVN
jgi:hypothetical protein